MTTLTAAQIKGRLIGLDGWLQGAGQSFAGQYTDPYIENVLAPGVIRRIERELNFRFNRAQVSSQPDGAYAPALASGGFGFFGGTGGTMVDQNGVTIPYIVESAYDFNPRDWQTLSPVRLRYGPVLQVQRLRVMYGGVSVYTPPAPWLQCNPVSRKVSVVPYQGSGYTAGTAASLSVAQAVFMGSQVPNAIAVDYMVGLADSWQADPQYADLELFLEERIALQILNDIGQTFSAGKQSTSASGGPFSQQLSFDRFMPRKQELQQSTKEFADQFAGEFTDQLSMGIV